MGTFAIRLVMGAAINTAIAGSSLGTAFAAQDTPTVSGEQVQAELRAARASGQMALLHEDSGSSWLSAQATSTATAVASSLTAPLAAALVGEDSASFYLSALAASEPAAQPQSVARVIVGR
ncbi:MAG TPA: hypothetical protein VEZ89_17290 [Rubrivivax sp.]|nr:hypothetical protein [Rubrivivax sp.]